MIYHILSSNSWQKVRDINSYKPEGFSKEGFIHCSKRDQIVAVANRYYQGQSDLIILEIDEDKLDSRVVFENLDGKNELFPHIYGHLNINSVVRFCPISLSDSDLTSFPDNWFPNE